MDQYRENVNQFEHALSYEINGQRQEVAFIHVGTGELTVGMATFGIGEEEPTNIIKLTLAELRLRFNFFTRLHQAGLF